MAIKVSDFYVGRSRNRLTVLSDFWDEDIVVYFVNTGLEEI